ncbi:MAG: GAP family protein [Nanoarchaeota archaeon]|nr:GAP family protein [Nanoarchaeota archaeon]
MKKYLLTKKPRTTLSLITLIITLTFLLFLSIILTQTATIQTAAAQTTDTTQTENLNSQTTLPQDTLSPPASPTSCIYYFYGNGCQYCEKVKPVLNDLQSRYPNLELHKFEIYHDKENSKLLNNFLDSYDYQGQRGIPALFIADKYFLGDKPIIENLEKELLDNPDAVCPKINGQGTGITGNTSPMTRLTFTSFIAIAGAAIVDSINPCAIAVLLILLTSLFLIGKPKKALSSGLAFTLSIFLMYFLIGLGLITLFKGISSVWSYAARILRIFIGFFAIGIGLANLKDFFWYGKGFTTEIPLKWRPILKRMLHKVTSPKGAFIIGIFVTAFELPCTGGPYFFVTGFLANQVSYAAIIPILLFYNFIFVLPLLILNFAFFFGLTTIEKTERWRQRNIRLLHLIAGMIMLGLGIMVFFV